LDGETALVLFGSAQVAARVLGPTADYIGEGIRAWTEHRVENVRRIFSKARRKLGSRIDEDGTISPRTLGRVIEDGSYCDDEVMVEYLGGLLASSRTPEGGDDRGAYWASIVTGLSSYQIRVHYLVYEGLRQRLEHPESPLSVAEINQKQIYIPVSAFASALDVPQDDGLLAVIAHCVEGLTREGLIAYRAYGTPDHLRGIIDDAEQWGAVVSPSGPGLELFGWAHGVGSRPLGPWEILASDDDPMTSEVNVDPSIRLVG
jgi:hypothetical protein